MNLTDFVRMKQQQGGATPAGRIQEAVGLLAQHEAALSQAATHRLPLREAPAAITLAKQREAVKVLLLPEPAMAPAR